jgi:hypothetical protein
VCLLGRKVYLGAIVILVTALEHGLTPSRRAYLVEPLDLWPQTLGRSRRWWREAFAASCTWRAAQGTFMPPVTTGGMPGALLCHLRGVIYATACYSA